MHASSAEGPRVDLNTNMDSAPSSVNAFEIKRKAHAVSRRESSLSTDKWNPFRHVWAKSHQRSHTWDAEAQRDVVEPGQDVGGTSPIEPSVTAPPGSSYRANENGRSSKEGDADYYNAERTQSSGDTAVPSQATDGSEIGLTLRKRKTETDRIETPTSNREDEEPKKKSRFKTVKPKEPFTVANQIQRTILNSWINVLLIAAPVGIILGALPDMNKYAIFIINFIAIIPLAAMLSFATEEIAMRTGETLGGLLNASFG